MNTSEGQRWMCGVTGKDNIRNEHIGGSTRVAQAYKKVTKRRLNWNRHVMRTDEEHVLSEELRTGREDDRKQDGKTRASAT